MGLMSYSDALSRLMSDVVCRNETETVALSQLTGRILAQEVCAKFDAPHFDNSAMDGYAVCGLQQHNWQLTNSIAAGDATDGLQLQAGQAMRILTGAAIPAGTDAVIAQEDVIVSEGRLIAKASPQSGQHIRSQAEEYAMGEVLLPKQMRLNAAAVGVIASQGLHQVPCFRRLKITVLSSGNELQVPGGELQENQIFDSYRAMLLAALADPCFDVCDGGLLADELSSITDNLQGAAANSDVVLVSGGASVGDKDYVKEALSDLGNIQHWKLAIKPGKPFGWGQIGHTQVFLLPGNPVASWVTFLALVQPALRVLAGYSQDVAMPKTVSAKAEFDVLKAQSRLQVLRGNVDVLTGRLSAHIHPQQGSAMLGVCAHSNALIMIPADTTINRGDGVDVMYLSA